MRDSRAGAPCRPASPGPGLVRCRGPPVARRQNEKDRVPPGLPLRLSSHSGSARSPHMPVRRTVAAAADGSPTPVSRGRVFACREPALAAAGGSSSCAASVCSRALLPARPVPSGAGGAAGALLLLVALARVVAGIGRRVSRCRPSRGAWWCARCWRAPVARGVVSRRVMIGSRPASTRSSATCSDSVTPRGRGGSRRRSSSSWSGLAPVMGWGASHAIVHERARFVRAHRKSVQRWLDDLQAAGMVAHEPERDGRGQWWRTQIVLLAAPATRRRTSCAVARVRARGWRRRERARRRARRARRALAAIRAPQRRPEPRVTRARLRAPGVASVHERAAARPSSADRRAGELREGRGLLTHPFGAPPTSAETSGSPKRFTEISNAG